MTTVEILIDCRERAAIEAAATQGLVHEVRQLDVGDFHILVDGALAVCVERKTYADLLSSIADGRFREQRDRMRCTIGARRMAYALEGFPDRVDGWDAGALTATLHMAHRDGIVVARTADVADTVRYLAALANRVAAEPYKYVTTDPPAQPGELAEGYASHLHSAHAVCRKKGANVDPGAAFRLMLSAVPGVSGTIATNVAAKAGDLATLMRALLACEDQPARLAYLTDIDKVGAKKAAAMLACMGFS